MNKFLIGAAMVLFSCGVRAEEQKTMTAQAVHERLQSEGEKPLVVDVREPDEFEAGHIDQAMLAPLGSVDKDLAGVAKDREIILVCRSGRRSGIAAKLLSERGYTKLWNMEGGMLAWQKLGYPIVKKD